MLLGLDAKTKSFNQDFKHKKTINPLWFLNCDLLQKEKEF